MMLTRQLILGWTPFNYGKVVLSTSYIVRKNVNYFLTRNSSGDEIANVNFLYDDIVHALKKQSTLA